MTKEDYMKLTKQRLAELLAERDIEKQMSDTLKQRGETSNFPFPALNGVPCFAPGGYCTNPHHDCINCPGKQDNGIYINHTTTGTINNKL